MPTAYSVDLRKRVLASYDEGMKPVDVIRQFRVSETFFYTLLKQRRETGSIEPKEPTGGPKPVLAEHLPELQELVKKKPDATLAELRQELSVPAGITTVWRALQDLGLTFKKSHPRRGAATA